MKKKTQKMKIVNKTRTCNFCRRCQRRDEKRERNDVEHEHDHDEQHWRERAEIDKVHCDNDGGREHDEHEAFGDKDDQVAQVVVAAAHALEKERLANAARLLLDERLHHSERERRKRKHNHHGRLRRHHAADKAKLGAAHSQPLVRALRAARSLVRRAKLSHEKRLEHRTLQTHYAIRQVLAVEAQVGQSRTARKKRTNSWLFFVKKKKN